MFESDIERSKLSLTERLISVQPFVYLRDVVNNKAIDYAYKQYFDAEFSWWLYEEQMLRHTNPHLDLNDPAIRTILGDLDSQYRRTARFDREQVTHIVDAAVKSILNYRVRPRTTLKWFVFRGEPTKPVYEVYLRMRYFADYQYLHEGFNQWLLNRGLQYDSMDIVSVLEFEKIIKKVDDDTILELSPSQFAELISPIYVFFNESTVEEAKQVVPVESIIVFLDDKEIHIIAQKMERMLYQQGVRYVSKETFLGVVDEVLNEVDTTDTYQPATSITVGEEQHSLEPLELASTVPFVADTKVIPSVELPHEVVTTPANIDSVADIIEVPDETSFSNSIEVVETSDIKPIDSTASEEEIVTTSVNEELAETQIDVDEQNDLKLDSNLDSIVEIASETNTESITDPVALDVDETTEPISLNEVTEIDSTNISTELIQNLPDLNIPAHVPSSFVVLDKTLDPFVFSLHHEQKTDVSQFEKLNEDIEIPVALDITESLPTPFTEEIIPSLSVDSVEEVKHDEIHASEVETALTQFDELKTEEVIPVMLDSEVENHPELTSKEIVFENVEDDSELEGNLIDEHYESSTDESDNLLQRLERIVTSKEEIKIEENIHNYEPQNSSGDSANGEILGIISRVLGNQPDTLEYIQGHDTLDESSESASQIETTKSVLGKGLSSLLTTSAHEVIAIPRPSVATFIDNKHREVFIKKLCNKDELRYDGLVTKLDRATKWKDALAFLDQFYAEQGVDPQSATARDLRMAVYKRFVNN